MAENGDVSVRSEVLPESGKPWWAWVTERSLLRAIALILLLFALLYWIRLIGVRAGPDFRFDTMATHWKLACAVMSVALPIASLGLWSGASWGVVLWMPIAATEILMYGWLTGLFGESQLRVGFHVVALFSYLAILLWERYLQRRNRAIAG